MEKKRREIEAKLAMEQTKKRKYDPNKQERR
jgi:hypothetical protein